MTNPERQNNVANNREKHGQGAKEDPLWHMGDKVHAQDAIMKHWDQTDQIYGKKTRSDVIK